MQKEEIREKKNYSKLVNKWKKPFSVSKAQSPFDWYRLDNDCANLKSKTDSRCPNALFIFNLEWRNDLYQ